ncbi:MAG: ABC transporter ATP-binding protein [Immundisolibacterales bacterium]|nr:ABC transporter ATP-binding protein [Immundisolibacterales bacterium]
MKDPLLRVRGLTRRFGGVVASDGIDLDVFEHEAHAIIGPNGAGKTTFIAQVAGFTLPDAGSIELAGREITRLPAHRRARLGLARSFQITSIFATLTVLENAALAVQAAAGHAYRMWGEALGDRELRSTALECLARVGLGDRAKDTAGDLSHGEHRQLEIAMALATRPRLLLLDEPMAGMGPEESVRMVSILRDLRRERTLLLVEHDMDAVFAIADRITVLVGGRVVASGGPEEVRSDPEVRRAYLGEDFPDSGNGDGNEDGHGSSSGP